MLAHNLNKITHLNLCELVQVMFYVCCAFVKRVFLLFLFWCIS